MEFSVKEIAQILSGEVVGDETQKINTLNKIEEGQKGSIAFLANPKYESYIYNTNASAVIVSKDFVPQKAVSTTLIKVTDPYSSFTSLLEEYNRILAVTKS